MAFPVLSAERGATCTLSTSLPKTGNQLRHFPGGKERGKEIEEMRWQ